MRGLRVMEQWQSDLVDSFKPPRKFISTLAERGLLPDWHTTQLQSEEDWARQFHRNFSASGWPDEIKYAFVATLDHSLDLASTCSVDIDGQEQTCVFLAANTGNLLQQVRALQNVVAVPSPAPERQGNMSITHSSLREGLAYFHTMCWE